MANEAVLIYETMNAIPFTCADGNALTKGSILKISDPMTAALTAGAVDNLAGIAGADKIASDGVTQIPVFRQGVFRMYASGSITVGDPVVTDSSVNYVKTAKGLGQPALSGSRVLGIALQTVTTGQQLLVDVRVDAGASS